MNLIIFTAGDKEYAADIRQVRQVIRLREVTVIPEAPDFVEGVIGLHHRAVSLISMRKKLGYEKRERNKSNRIIIAQINSHMVGMVVDKVIDVVAVGAESIELPDEVLKEARCLTGIAEIQERLIPIIDIAKLLTHKDKIQIAKVHKRVKIVVKKG